jgi:hypothetical protein
MTTGNPWFSRASRRQSRLRRRTVTSQLCLNLRGGIPHQGHTLGVSLGVSLVFPAGSAAAVEEV